MVTPRREMPMRAREDPPSGTEEPVAAEKENLCPKSPPPGSCVEKLQVPNVGSNPFPETVPVPVTVTVAGLPPWEKIEDEMRSKVNPPTV